MYDILHRSQTTHRKKRLRIFVAFLLCSILILTNFLGVASKMDASLSFAYAEDAELADENNSTTETEPTESSSNDSSSSSSSSSSEQSADDAKNELGEFREITQKEFTNEDLTNMLEDTEHPAVPGNLWSGLGGTGKYFAGFTKSTSTVAYDDLASEDIRLGGAATYGYVLDRTGLDHSFSTSTSEEIIYKMARFLLGAVLYGGYALQIGVNWIFALIVDIADYVNIFGWIAKETTIQYDDTHSMKSVTFGDSLVTIDDNSPFAGLRDIVVQLYKGVAGIGLGLAILGFAVSVLLAVLGWKVSSSKRTSMGSGMLSAVGKFVFRCFIILATPIVIGSIYTGILDKTKDAYSGSTVSDYALYSNMIDFAKWVKHSRLALPDGKIEGLIYTTDDGKISPVTHDTILRINAYSAGLRNARDTLDVYNNTTNKEEAKYGKKTDTSQDGIEAQNDEGVNDWGMAVISRWATMAEYSSSMFESYAKMDYYKVVLKKDASEASKKTFIDLITVDGTLELEGNKRNGLYKTGKPLLQPDDSSKSSDALIGTAYGGSRNGVNASAAGLSTLGMYNYLTTVFTPTSMTYTDTESLASKVSAPYHAAVGLAGRGFVAFGNYMLMFSMIWSMAVLGFMFAMYAINALIVSIPKIIGNLIASTLGSPIFFIKLFMAVIIVGIEILGGAIFYMIAQTVMMGIATIGDSMTTNALGTITPITGVVGNSISTTLYGVVNVIASILLMFTVFLMIKWRGRILGMFGTMIENSLNSIFGMFETTAQGTQNFQGGRNGLYTTDEQGNNQFSNIDGSKNSFSDALHGRGEGDGSGSNNRGSQERSSKVHGAKSLLGKGYNAASEMRDRISSEEARLGRPLTGAEKAKVIGSEIGTRSALGALKGASAAIGSEGGVNLAKDIDGIRDAKVEDGLRSRQNDASAIDRMTQDVAQGSTGAPQNVQEIEDYERAVKANPEAFNADGTSKPETDSVPTVSHTEINSGAQGGNSTGAPIQADSNNHIQRDSTNQTDANINAESEISSTNDINAVNGDANSAPIPVFASQAEGAKALADAKQQVYEAEFNARNAETPLQQETTAEALQTAKAELAAVEAGVAGYAEGSTAEVQKELGAVPIPVINSATQGQNVLKNAENVAEKAQRSYNDAVIAKQAGANVPAAKLEQLREAATTAQQTVVATQQAVNQFNNSAQQQNASNSTTAVNGGNIQQTSTSPQQATATTAQSGGNTQATNNVQQTTNVAGSSVGGSTVQHSTTATSTNSNTSTSSSIPKFSSFAQSNHTIMSAQRQLTNAKTILQNLPQSNTAQRTQVQQQVDKAQQTLRMAQAGASQLFKAQPSTLVREVQGKRASNEAVAKSLQNVRNAQVQMRQMAVNGNGSGEEARQIKAQLKQAQADAVKLGIDKKFLSSPSALEQAMKSLNNQHASAISGTTSKQVKQGNSISDLQKRQAEMMAEMNKGK